MNKKIGIRAKITFVYALMAGVIGLMVRWIVKKPTSKAEQYYKLGCLLKCIGFIVIIIGCFQLMYSHKATFNNARTMDQNQILQNP